MRDPERIGKICTKLQELWNLVPDARFFQLVDYICPYEIDDPYHVEDDIIIQKIQDLIDQFKKGS